VPSAARTIRASHLIPNPPAILPWQRGPHRRRTEATPRGELARRLRATARPDPAPSRKMPCIPRQQAGLSRATCYLLCSPPLSMRRLPLRSPGPSCFRARGRRSVAETRLVPVNLKARFETNRRPRPDGMQSAGSVRGRACVCGAGRGCCAEGGCGLDGASCPGQARPLRPAVLAIAQGRRNPTQRGASRRDRGQPAYRGIPGMRARTQSQRMFHTDPEECLYRTTQR
jgi:hypothetical protein